MTRNDRNMDLVKMTHQNKFENEHLATIPGKYADSSMCADDEIKSAPMGGKSLSAVKYEHRLLASVPTNLDAPVTRNVPIKMVPACGFGRSHSPLSVTRRFTVDDDTHTR